MVKVSVIVPVYNTEKYIERCLNSLVSQTLQDIEIICVNDGSTDNSLNLLNKYASKYAKVKVITQENNKQGAARNTGIKAAQGEYIGFVDSDDWVDEDYFENLYNAATEYDADISSGNLLKHKKKIKRYNVLYKEFKTAANIQEKIRLCCDNKNNFFYVLNRLYRKELLKSNNILFSEGVFYEDVIFSAKSILYANKVVSVPSGQYHYMLNPNSTVKSKKNQESKNLNKVKALEELMIFAKQNDIKLPERLNYSESKWVSPFVKLYTGVYKKKYLLFGLVPIFVVNKEQVNG